VSHKSHKTYLSIFLVLAFGWSASSMSGQSAAVPKTHCQTSFPSDDRVAWTCVQVTGEKTLTALGPYLWDVLRFNRIDRMHALRGAYLKIPVVLDDAVGFTPMPATLPQAKAYPRYILVDRAEQFLGAYEFGELKFSLPAATGRHDATPAGIFPILARDRWHRSSPYTVSGTDIPYPMFWAMKFAVAKSGHGLWFHSRDMPGYPASHGCVGLYDEEMQLRFYGYPPDPHLMDSKRLYQWAFGENAETPQMYPGGLDGILVEIK